MNYATVPIHPLEVKEWKILYCNQLVSKAVGPLEVSILSHYCSLLNIWDGWKCVLTTLQHYLLESHMFYAKRNEMLNELQGIGFQPSLQNLLYGNSQYSDGCNIQAFDIIQSFIHVTGGL